MFNLMKLTTQLVDHAFNDLQLLNQLRVIALQHLIFDSLQQHSISAAVTCDDSSFISKHKPVIRFQR